MSSLVPAGTFPTPYGVSVPVFEHPSNPEEFVFSMDATAICAGIYDPAARRRFVEAANTGRRIPSWEEFGGGSPPRIPLPRPQSPIFLTLPRSSTDLPVDAWITAALDRHRWCDRADVLIDIIGGNMEAEGFVGWKDIQAIGLSMILTATLEHLPDNEIDCLEAAAFYALATHAEWVAAGNAWLDPVRETWFRDWAEARPRYRTFAAAVAEIGYSA